jgi:hypothetical protein
VKHTRSKKKRRDLITVRIIYRNRQHPHDRPRELTVDFRRGEQVDADYAAGIVAVRTSMPLAEVQIIDIVGESG